MPAISDAFNNDETRLGRFLTTAAHWSLWGIAIIATVRILGYLGVHHWLISASDLIALVPILFAMFHTTYTRLCVRCMEEVPADASVRAQRQRWLLWVTHSLESPRKVAVWIGVVMTISVLTATFHLPRIVDAPIDAYWLAYLYSMWLHHKLRPWCPYCRRWDDGGFIHEPSPDPVVKATR